MAINVFKLISRCSAISIIIFIVVFIYLIMMMTSRLQIIHSYEKSPTSAPAQTNVKPRTFTGRFGGFNIRSAVGFNMGSAVSFNDWIFKFYEGYKSLQVGHKVFSPIVTSAERRIFHELLVVYVEAMERHRIPYYICDGTLLGSWRHHGMIPWDDDIDICMDTRDQDRISEALEQLAPEYLVIRNDTSLWKFFPQSNSSPVNGWNWSYPFIDLCFSVTEPRVATVKRPFWDLEVNAPRDAEQFLKKYDDMEQCETVDYSHRREVWISSTTSLACSELSYAFPFVVHQTLARGTVETLKFNNSVVTTFHTALK